MTGMMDQSGPDRISDYDKGTGHTGLVAHTVDLARKHGGSDLKADLNLNLTKYTPELSVLTPNQKEAAVAANMDITCQKDLFAAGESLF